MNSPLSGPLNRVGADGSSRNRAVVLLDTHERARKRQLEWYRGSLPVSFRLQSGARAFLFRQTFPPENDRRKNDPTIRNLEVS